MTYDNSGRNRRLNYFFSASFAWILQSYICNRQQFIKFVWHLAITALFMVKHSRDRWVFNWTFMRLASAFAPCPMFLVLPCPLLSSLPVSIHFSECNKGLCSTLHSSSSLLRPASPLPRPAHVHPLWICLHSGND